MFKICLSLLLLCLPLQSIYPNPCQWELGAELFFFTTEDFPFAEAVTMTTGTNFSSGRGNDVLFDPSYKPGFRLEAAAIFDCLHAFDMRFTYFDAIISNQATGHFSMLNNPLEHQATATLKQRFYEIEFLFGRWLFQCNRFDVLFSAGAQYSNLRFKTTSSLSAPPTGGFGIETFREDTVSTKVWGIGPEVVFDISFPLTCGFFLKGDARLALLSQKTISSSSDTIVSDFGLENSSAEANPIWGVGTYRDLRIGLQWMNPCLCLHPNVELGYEWLLFDSSFINNFSFHGPYLAVGCTF